ncbi:ABC transporter permease [Listeria newyorkensis]|uniref:ABC transporter permease n=1 Tax=Listeria newyorkensis TaxID=1497681 RepID=A0A841YYK1_9LIST|nr:ABC transporter permease [Listeria newyorkensis]MBC1458388.1 ABC transporter permease [Listeria newyorkensis]
MSKFWVITSQVYKRRVKTKSFLISLLLPLLIGAAIFALPKIVDYFGDGDEPTKIAVISENPAFSMAIAADKANFKVDKKIETEKAAKKALTAGDIEGFVKITPLGNEVNAVYTSQETAGNALITALQNDITSVTLQQKIKEYNITEKQLASLTTPVPVKNELLSNDQLTNSQKEAMSAAILMLTLVIFIFVMSYASIVAAEIANEKGTRIMEIILSSVSSTTHLMAKLTAILLMLLTQIAFYGLCIAVVMIGGKNTEMIQGILDQLAQFPTYYLILNLLFVVLGLLLYILLSAIIGSMAPNVETVSQFMYPMTMFAIIGYWGSIAAANAPNNMLVVIGSYVPTFSPMMMLARMDLLAVDATGIFISLGILALTNALAFWLAIRLYRGNVLLYTNDGLFKTWKTSLKYAKRD